MTTTTDGLEPLFRAADLMPLSRSLGMVEPEDDVPGGPGGRPFGLGFATATVAPVIVDLSGLHYDTDRQLSVDDAGIAVFGKHSTGQTTTRTSDGHKSMDSDTDHTED
ncbi:MAG: putative ATP-grasp-modified RiPP [Pseudonocardiaceae bacterium]